jgi:hypothetical protein
VADFVFNVAKGKIAEYAARVNANDPANSALIICLFNTSATDATLKDLDTLAAIEADANTAELTSGSNANYVRKTLTDASGITITVDDTNDRVDVDIPDQTWAALGAGTAVTDMLVAYDSDTTGGADSAIVPLTWHDFAVTPDGSDVTAQIAAAGFFRAS